MKLLLIPLLFLLSKAGAASLSISYQPNAINGVDPLGNPIIATNQNGTGNIGFAAISPTVELSDITEFSFTAYIFVLDALGLITERQIVFGINDLSSVSISFSGTSLTSFSLQANQSITVDPFFDPNPKNLLLDIQSDFSGSITQTNPAGAGTDLSPSTGSVTIIPEPSSSMLMFFSLLFFITRRSRN